MSTSHLDIGDRQVWLRAFYGFDPEESGYIGFTNSGDHRVMMEQMRDGDLVLIYGAVEDLTDQDLRAQALGFLEISLAICTDRERMSDDAYADKVQRGFQERWTHGIKVRRAWRIRNRVSIRTIAPDAYDHKNRFTRTTRAILLTPDERERALSHPVRQTNVFGEPPILDENLPAGPMEALLRPSRGVPPGFGERTSAYEDGENQLYLMLFNARADLLLGKSIRPDHALAKVGRSNDPNRRLRELNFGFPAPTSVGWKLAQTHIFPDGATAHSHEDLLKGLFEREFTSQSGEFFTGPQKAMAQAFQSYCIASSPKILGAPAKAKGI